MWGGGGRENSRYVLGVDLILMMSWKGGGGMENR